MTTVTINCSIVRRPRADVPEPRRSAALVVPGQTIDAVTTTAGTSAPLDDVDPLSLEFGLPHLDQRQQVSTCQVL